MVIFESGCLSIKNSMLLALVLVAFVSCRHRPVQGSLIKDGHSLEDPPAQGYSALLVIDMQNCFLEKGGATLENGSLAVRGGVEIIPVVNQLMNSTRYDFVVATQDWHPAGHMSFASTHARDPFTEITMDDGTKQMLWPDHCIENTYGAELSSDFVKKFDYIQHKGINPDVDSYSGFFDNNRKGKTELDMWLKEHGVTKVAVVGIATDYCVAFTALDAVDLGYEVTLIRDATVGVNNPVGQIERQIELMEKKGVRVINSIDLLHSW